MNLSIPLDKSPQTYSGLGDMWQQFSGSLVPQAGNWINNYNANANNAFNQAQNGLSSIVSNQINPAIQNSINKLAGRGMLNSSVASEAINDATTNATNTALNYGARLNANRASSLMDYGNQLFSAVNTGQHSSTTNELAPYQLMAQLLMANM